MSADGRTPLGFGSTSARFGRTAPSPKTVRGTPPPARASTALESMELASIDRVSFVPVGQLDALFARSREAEKTTDRRMLSKAHALPPHFGLCPADLDPNETVLARLGRKSGIHNGRLAVVDDRNMPFGGGSAGPNVVLMDCTLPGSDRGQINLIHRDVPTTLALAEEVLDFRRTHGHQLFRAFVHKIAAHDRNYAIDATKAPDGGNALPEALREDYSAVRELFELLLQRLEGGRGRRLSDIGLGVTSFCQTWAREGGVVGEPQFSIMSPHFQTRHFVQDEGRVRAIAAEGVGPERADALLQSYQRIIECFDRKMAPYVSDADGSGSAFVNVDQLVDHLRSRSQ